MFFLFKFTFDRNAIFGGETLSSPQDGEIEAAIIVFPPFFCSLTPPVNVKSPSKQTEVKLKFYDLITVDYLDMAIQNGIDVKWVFFFCLGKRVTKGLYCGFHNFPSYS